MESLNVFHLQVRMTVNHTGWMILIVRMLKFFLFRHQHVGFILVMGSAVDVGDCSAEDPEIFLHFDFLIDCRCSFWH